jgi:profilin
MHRRDGKKKCRKQSLIRVQVHPQEMKEVVAAYKDKGDAQGVKQVQSTGLHVAGERYVVLKADERSLYGKKVSHSVTV